MFTKREFLRSTTLTAFAVVATKSVPALAQTSVTPADVRAIAKEAYIWGYPIVDTGRAVYTYFVDRSNPEYKAPWNQIANDTRLFTPADTAVQTINADTLYSWLGLDVRDEPMVISVPEVEKSRYYGCSLFDLWGTAFDYIGTRATGNEAGNFLIAGPGWKGETPKGIKKVFVSETSILLPAFRTQLFNPEDIENVKKVQAGYKVQSLSAFLGTPAPKSTPVDFVKALTVEQEKTSLAFFTNLNSLLQFAPTVPSEIALRARFATIGIGEGKTFDPSKLSPEIRTAFEQGVADAWVDIDGVLKRMNSGDLPLGDLIVTRASPKFNYANRAAVIVFGGPSQPKEEVVYVALANDADGKPWRQQLHHPLCRR
jgi:hypothetical protein